MSVERQSLVVTVRSVLEFTALVAFIVLASLLATKLYRDLTRQAGAVRAGGRPVPPQAQALLPSEPVSIAGAALKGNRAAKVAILEFSDFECPYCGRFARSTLRELERRYIATGRVLFAYVHFPLASLHRNAHGAAAAALCASDEGRFWEMHDRLFAGRVDLGGESLRDHASALRLDSERFDACRTSRETAGRIQRDIDMGLQLGVTGTPTFFVGLMEGENQVRLVARVIGGQALAGFERVLNGLLEGE